VTTDLEPSRILIVEDEPGMVRYLRFGLAREGFAVQTAMNGRAAREAVERDEVDLVILDLVLPDIDGIELIKLWRATRAPIPIIVLSNRTQERQMVEALELGADDYMTKPFGMAELIARIRTTQRHYASRRQQADRQRARPIYRSGDLVVDLEYRIATVRGERVHLSPRQYRLLEFLVENAGKLLTRELILREVWTGTTDVQYLRIYIRALRRKIEPHPERPIYIMTEIGVGYRMRPTD
jgi:two-component system KDP operon response regulator KdpE